MSETLALSLIDKIKSFESRDFVQWYQSMCLSNANMDQEQELFNQVILDGTSNRFYRLFTHLESNVDHTSNYVDLISIISQDYEYFIQNCKNELIKKLSSHSNLYLMKFEISQSNANSKKNLFEFVVQELEKKPIYRDIFSYEKMEEVTIYIIKLKFKIIKLNQPIHQYTELLDVGKIFELEYSIQTKKYYGIDQIDYDRLIYDFSQVKNISISLLE